MFFNIGGGEILVIALIALIAIGPEQLPGVMRKVGSFVGQARTITAGLRDEFMSGVDELSDTVDVNSWMGSGSDDDPVVPRGYADTDAKTTSSPGSTSSSGNGDGNGGSGSNGATADPAAPSAISQTSTTPPFAAFPPSSASTASGSSGTASPSSAPTEPVETDAGAETESTAVGGADSTGDDQTGDEERQ